MVRLTDCPDMTIVVDWHIKEVEGAYWFGPVRLSVTLAYGQERLKIGS